MLTRIAARVAKLRNRHVFVLDVLIFAGAPLVALALRLDGEVRLERYGDSLAALSVATVLIGTVVLWRYKLYKRIWRFASIDEAIRLGVATAVILLLETGAFFIVLRPLGLVDEGFPRSIPLLAVLVSFPLVISTRLSARVAQRIAERFRPITARKRAIIAGAGEAGVAIVSELQTNRGLGIEAVAFVDDASEKKGVRIRGLEVVGRASDVAAIASAYKASLVIIAMPNMSGELIRGIVETAKAAGLETRVVPSISELVDDRVRVSQLRPVQVEDLLRRPTVPPDRALIDGLIGGKRVLITGAGGSIGSELCRQVHRARPAGMLIVGHGENSVFRIAAEFRAGDLDIPIDAAIADVRDVDRLERLFDRFRPEIVFHAAAHKHVPLMESNVEEAITNNVQGTRNVALLSDRFGVERFLMISTDKAVHPTSVMGCSKRVAEMIVYSEAARTGKPFMAVRFGNVLGSRGSVLETFRRQIAAGGPVTVTDPEVNRFFMTIPEAVQLVLQACALGSGGEVFVLDMGAPVRIADLALDLIRLSGLEEGRDIEIEFTGLRPGEKLYEELFLPDEEYERTRHPKIFVCRSAMDAVGSSISGASDGLEFRKRIDGLLELARDGREEEVLRTLKELVPEYTPARELMPEAHGEGQRRALAARLED